MGSQNGIYTIKRKKKKKGRRKGESHQHVWDQVFGISVPFPLTSQVRKMKLVFATSLRLTLLGGRYSGCKAMGHQTPPGAWTWRKQWAALAGHGDGQGRAGVSPR